MTNAWGYDIDKSTYENESIECFRVSWAVVGVLVVIKYIHIKLYINYRYHRSAIFGCLMR